MARLMNEFLLLGDGAPVIMPILGSVSRLVGSRREVTGMETEDDLHGSIVTTDLPTRLLTAPSDTPIESRSFFRCGSRDYAHSTSSTKVCSVDRFGGEGVATP